MVLISQLTKLKEIDSVSLSASTLNMMSLRLYLNFVGPKGQSTDWMLGLQPESEKWILALQAQVLDVIEQRQQVTTTKNYSRQ